MENTEHTESTCQTDNAMNSEEAMHPESASQTEPVQGEAAASPRSYGESNPMPQNNGHQVIMIAIIILSAIGVLFVLSLLLVFIIASKLMPDRAYHEQMQEEIYQEEPAWDGTEEYRGRGAYPDIEEDEDEGDDPFLRKDYVNRWGTNHENHKKEEFQGEFYENIYECIDDSTAYEIKREYYEYAPAGSDVVIQVGYYQLEGNLPNLDSINEELSDAALFMAYGYFDDYGEEDYKGEMSLLTDSYVTYNDDKVLSVVLDDNWAVNGKTGFDLYGVNIDLQNGMVMDNTKILETDEAFARVFRERNRRQNETDGPIPVFSDLTDGQLSRMLSSGSNLILFYTPMGMEVGFNYVGAGYSGWVTVTFQDYEEYLQSL